MACKPLGRGTLTAEEIKNDRKVCKKYDQCGLGRKAVYVPSRMMPRSFYIPYENVERIYQRVAVSKGSGKAFLTPVLYIVFQYDGAQEKACYFKYITDSDKMFAQLRREHPEIPLLSEKSEQEEAAKRAEEDRILSAQLTRQAAACVRDLSNARELLEMRPKLYKNLAQAARFKRSMDLIRPGYQRITALILAAGAVCLTAGFMILGRRQNRSPGIILALLGIAAIFLMINSGILPTPGRNRKAAGRQYDHALDSMKHSLKGAGDFPVPAEYAHPYVLDMMERIIREGRAEMNAQALAVLKEDLKKMDNTVQLGGDEYVKVHTVKPLFLVTDYR